MTAVDDTSTTAATATAKANKSTTVYVGAEGDELRVRADAFDGSALVSAEGSSSASGASFDRDASLYATRVPSTLAFEAREFKAARYRALDYNLKAALDPDVWETQDASGQNEKMHMGVYSVVRWRRGEDGRRESNARVVTWSDGSKSLVVGKEVYDLKMQRVAERSNFIYAAAPPDTVDLDQVSVGVDVDGTPLVPVVYSCVGAVSATARVQLADPKSSKAHRRKDAISAKRFFKAPSIRNTVIGAADEAAARQQMRELQAKKRAVRQRNQRNRARATAKQKSESNAQRRTKALMRRRLKKQAFDADFLEGNDDDDDIAIPEGMGSSQLSQLSRHHPGVDEAEGGNRLLQAKQGGEPEQIRGVARKMAPQPVQEEAAQEAQQEEAQEAAPAAAEPGGEADQEADESGAPAAEAEPDAAESVTGKKRKIVEVSEPSAEAEAVGAEPTPAAEEPAAAASSTATDADGDVEMQDQEEAPVINRPAQKRRKLLVDDDDDDDEEDDEDDEDEE